MAQLPLKQILAEILLKCDDDADAKELLERAKEVLDGYDTLNDDNRKEPITVEDVIDKVDNQEELTSMEKYLLMMQKMQGK